MIYKVPCNSIYFGLPIGIGLANIHKLQDFIKHNNSDFNDDQLNALDESESFPTKSLYHFPEGNNKPTNHLICAIDIFKHVPQSILDKYAICKDLPILSTNTIRDEMKKNNLSFSENASAFFSERKPTLTKKELTNYSKYLIEISKKSTNVVFRAIANANSIISIKMLVYDNSDLVRLNDPHGNNAFHLAATMNMHQLFPFLKEQGLGNDYKNLYGFTPLALAVINGCTEAMTALIVTGADLTMHVKADFLPKKYGL